MLPLLDYCNLIQDLQSSKIYSTFQDSTSLFYRKLSAIGCVGVNGIRLSFNVFEDGLKLKTFILPDFFTNINPYIGYDQESKAFYIGVSSNSNIIHHKRFTSFDEFLVYISNYIEEHIVRGKGE